jgi:hypothetical protein
VKASYSANIFLIEFIDGVFFYRVVPLSKNRDTYDEAMRAAMAETARYSGAAGFVIRRVPSDSAGLFWDGPPPPAK